MTEIDQATAHATRGRRGRQLRSNRRSLLAGPAAAIGFGLLLLSAPGQGQTPAKRPAADSIGDAQPTAFRKESTMTQLAQAEPAPATAAAAIRPFRVDLPEEALADLRRRVKGRHDPTWTWQELRALPSVAVTGHGR